MPSPNGIWAGEPISQGTVLKVAVPKGVNPSIPQGEAGSCKFPPNCSSLCQRQGLQQEYISAFPIHMDVIFPHSRCIGVAQTVSGFLLEGIVPCRAVDFRSVGGGESWSLQWCHLISELSSFHFLKSTLWLTELKDRWYWGRRDGWPGGLGLTYAHWGIWNDWPMGTCCIAQRTQPNILWRSMQNLRENGYVYMYGWVTCHTAEIITIL